jgi:hypothetical protein
MSLSIRTAKLVLLIIAMVFGTFEPAGRDPLFRGGAVQPSQTARKNSKPLVLRGGHNLADNYPDDDRLRRPSEPLCQIQPLENAVNAGVDRVLKAMTNAIQNRRAFCIYLTKDHPACSPGRWRC